MKDTILKIMDYKYNWILIPLAVLAVLLKLALN